MSKKVVSDEVEFIHELISILKEDGFTEIKNSCPFCMNRRPKLEPRKCPVCNKLCYPVGLKNERIN